MDDIDIKVLRLRETKTLLFGGRVFCWTIGFPPFLRAYARAVASLDGYLDHTTQDPNQR